MNNLTHTQANVVKYLLAAAVAISLCITFMQYTRVQAEAAQSNHKRALLLTFMQGGLPAVTARCIIETPDPTQVKDCVRLATPNPGRAL